MIARTLIAAGLLALSPFVAAETPNMQPGMWEYHNKMTFQSDFPIPDQEHTNQECVTLEDIERGDAFLEDVEDCEITHQDIRRDGMDYSMTCRSPDGTEMTMDATMDFHGDSANGVIDGTMQTPMGDMSMRINMSGRRVGDC